MPHRIPDLPTVDVEAYEILMIGRSARTYRAGDQVLKVERTASQNPILKPLDPKPIYMHFSNITHAIANVWSSELQESTLHSSIISTARSYIT